MSSARRNFVLRMHLIGIAAALLLTGVVAVLLARAVGPDSTGAVRRGRAAVPPRGPGARADRRSASCWSTSSSRPAAPPASRSGWRRATSPRCRATGGPDQLTTSLAGDARQAARAGRHHSPARARGGRDVAGDRGLDRADERLHRGSGEHHRRPHRARQPAGLVVRAAAEDASKILDIAQELAAGPPRPPSGTGRSRGWRGRTASGWT